MPVERPHLVIQNPGLRLEFAPKGGGGKSTYFPAVNNRRATADRILEEVASVVATGREAAAVFQQEDVVPMTVRAGTNYGVNSSIPAPRRNEVLSFFGYDKNARVNVALDPNTLDTFGVAAERYVAYVSGEGRKPNHFNFFEAQPEIVPTTVADLWASNVALPDLDAGIGWEVWVQPVAEPRFRAALEILGIRNPPRGVEFASVRVIGLEATRRDFERIAQSASIAQLRPASALNTGLMNMPSGVQQLAVTAAARRVTVAQDDAPAVCVLDTGVRADHPLLRLSLRFAGVAGGSFAPDDYDGHGTKMAGIALFTDLPNLIAGGSAGLSINLESIVVEPPPGMAQQGSLAAARLREAVDAVERNNPRSRTFCLAMNATDESDDGSPSSLSSEVDLLSFEVARPRIFCVAAGNVGGTQPVQGDYQALNETSGILSPAQAWNALTVAACTDLGGVPPTHLPVAPLGDLSPWSRTSVIWEPRHKPASKPDVVFEGGNQMIDRVSSAVGLHPDLCLLTTSPDLATPLTMTGETSAATAAIAGLCASLQAEYPHLWPETVRGLVVHSADHTPSMRSRAVAAVGPNGSVASAILQRFGYGRPDRQVAMQNAEDALTMIIQGYLVPLRPNGRNNGTILGFMKFHSLPWPIEVLEELGDTDAELRVTLSYFVEPNPGFAIRGDMDLYPSHNLDFDVKRPDESDEQAIGRVNAAHPAARQSTADVLPWEFGRFRARGGLKHDRLKTSAENLARMGGVTVLPRKGWWGRDMDHLEQQVRYALIMSIRTPGEEIYAEIASQIEVEG